MEETVSKQDIETELIPAAGSEKVGAKVFDLLRQIIDDKVSLNLHDSWNYYYRLGKNRHWKRESNKTSLVSINLLFTHRSKTINMLTDNNPTFNVVKIGEETGTTEEVYDLLLHTAQFWWHNEEQQDVLEESVFNGETYGCAIEKVVFNPDREFGFGEVETLPVDPFHFGLYPVKTRHVQKAQAVLHYYPMSVFEARRKWPDQAQKIIADEDILKELGDERREIQEGKPGLAKSYFTTFSSTIKHILGWGEEGSEKPQETLIVECWVKDTSKNRDGTFKYKGNIRCITTCSMGQVTLDDRDNPSINPLLEDEKARLTYLYDKFPFSRNPSNKNTSNPWGDSDFEQLSKLNIELDKAISRFNMYVDKASQIKLINPKDSGVPNSHFTNEPGIINPADRLVAQAIRYMETPQAPTDVYKALDIYKDFFFIVANSFDLSRAQNQDQRVIAYKAIAALLENAAVMLRGKIRNYSKMIRERGRMYISHVQNWYSEERWIEFEQDGDKVQTPITGWDLIVPAKLTVVSGSTMPVSQVQKREEALEMFKLGLIDQEETLKSMDWANRKQVLERMRLGPLSNVLDVLMQIGAPETIIQLISELSKMDKKEIDQLLKSGQLPMFQQLIVPDEENEDPEMDADVILKNAQAQKIAAEIDLIAEKILTERVDQQVKMKGIQFDEEKLKIERADVVNKLEANVIKKSEQRGTPPYREKGMKSNNQEV